MPADALVTLDGELLRVEANLLWLRPGRVGGTETYALNLLAALANEPSVAVRVVVNKVTAQTHPWLTSAFDCDVVSVLGKQAGRVGAEWMRYGAPVRRSTAGRAAGGHRPPVDVTHHLGAAMAGPLPMFGQARRPPRVVSIFDTQFIDLPENFTRSRRSYLRKTLRSAIKHSHVVCAATQWAGEALSRHFASKLNDAMVVPPAIAPQAGAQVRPVALNAGAARDFVVYPAVTWPHKRHELLVDVAEELARRDPSSVPTFVFCGGDGPTERDLLAKLASSSVADRFVRLGRVEPNELAWLYEHARALVFPSAYEGLGQPPLEAMAAGCPVIAAGGTAVNEVVGDGGLLVGDSPSAWADALAHLTQPSARAELIAKGTRRVAHYSPTAAAKAQVAAYEAAIDAARKPPAGS